MRPSNWCRFVGISIAIIWSVERLHDDIAAQQPGTEHMLFQAIHRGDVRLLKDLLQRGTDADVRAKDGTTPLMQASLHGTAEMVALLLKYGADPAATNPRGVTALHWGASEIDKVKLLLAHGADPRVVNSSGNSPLTVAAGSPTGAASVKALLVAGATMTANKAGRTPLRFAASGGDVETVRLLLEKARELGELKKTIREAGPTVAIAANNGFGEIIALLLEQGADPNRSNGSRGASVNAALMSGHEDVARNLVSRGADLNRRSQPGNTPVSVLAAYNELDDLTFVDFLKEKGVDFKEATSKNETALTWARMRGHHAMIEMLVGIGANEGKLPARPEIPSRTVASPGRKRQAEIAQAVQKSIDLLQLSSDTFLDVRSNCVSCHHQNMPSVAIAWARDRGFHVRQESMDRMVARQVKSWEPRIARAYELDSPFPVAPRFLGWGMWSFAELGYRPNDLTRAVSWYIAATQQADGRWAPGMLRPPLGGNEILATTLAMRTLQLYPLQGRVVETERRVDLARRWLQAATPRTHQDHVSRLMGLSWAGVESDKLSGEAHALLKQQRADGGWAQLPGLESDAWATGQTLVALHNAGAVATDDDAYQRGLEMLLSTQFEDGSWYVQARAWPFQPYFESKFPHGRDQWISAPATAWAVMALVLAADRDDAERLKKSYAAKATQPKIKRPHNGGTPRKLPAAAKIQVDFKRDIEPILARSCVGCHGTKKPQSNFSVLSRAAIMRGGDSELPAVLPDASKESPLVRFAAGLEPEMEMPPLDSRKKYPPLSDKEVSLLRAWIDQGAKWNDKSGD